MTVVFVTSSGTGIGKTLVAAALVGELRRRGEGVRVLKPVISGYCDTNAAGSDSGVLLAAMGEPVTPAAVAAISPWRFAAPLSPDMAAAREGSGIVLDDVVGFCRRQAAAASRQARTLVIEGVGGVMAPITASHTVADWIARLGCPAVLVVGSYLGSLSHSLTAAESLAARGIGISAVIVSESADSGVSLDDTVATLARFLPAIPAVALPRLPPGPRPWEAAPPLVEILGLAGAHP